MPNITVSATSHPQHKDITLISVKGFIDTNTAPDFDKTFQAVLGEKKYNLVIDLKDTSYISSAGWGIFVGEIKRIRNQKGNLFLASMNPEVTEAYELLQFDTILKSFPTAEQAIQKGFGRSRAAKGPEASKTEMAQGGASPKESSVVSGMDQKLEAAPVHRPLRKPHWLVRIFIPWKWF
jgi:anti-anti-sigma factor